MFRNSIFRFYELSFIPVFLKYNSIGTQFNNIIYKFILILQIKILKKNKIKIKKKEETIEDEEKRKIEENNKQ